MKSGASVIIVTFNSAATVVPCLLSVIPTLRATDEVLIIDNNSQDHTLALIREFRRKSQNRIRLFPQKTNRGFSKGCNIGIENSNKEFIVLLNPDTEVFGDWIQRLTDHFKYYPKTGAVGPVSNQCLQPQQIRTFLPNYKHYAGDVYHLLDVLRNRFNRKSLPRKLLMGFCMVLSRKIVQDLGPLDEDIFLGDEDLEMSWRLRENGYYLRVALDVFINHERHTSFKTLPQEEVDQFIQQGTDVLFTKMQKHYEPAKVPHPAPYFNINWWRPSILKEKSELEVFDRDLLKFGHSEIIPATRELIKQKRLDHAIKLLEDSLRIIVDDYLMWYTLGSLCLITNDFEKAELALKNAWALEDSSCKARGKLLKLFSEQHCSEKAVEFFGEMVSC